MGEKLSYTRLICFSLRDELRSPRSNPLFFGGRRLDAAGQAITRMALTYPKRVLA